MHVLSRRALRRKWEEEGEEGSPRGRGRAGLPPPLCPRGPVGGGSGLLPRPPLWRLWSAPCAEEGAAAPEVSEGAPGFLASHGEVSQGQSRRSHCCWHWTPPGPPPPRGPSSSSSS